MEKQIYCLIRMMSITTNEVVINIKLPMGEFNSIEILKDKSMVLHQFKDDLDVLISIDDFDFDDQQTIYNTLKVLLYN
jgi:hypothetical protein